MKIKATYLLGKLKKINQNTSSNVGEALQIENIFPCHMKCFIAIWKLALVEYLKSLGKGEEIRTLNSLFLPRKIAKALELWSLEGMKPLKL